MKKHIPSKSKMKTRKILDVLKHSALLKERKNEYRLIKEQLKDSKEVK
jgi:hypothetical protein